MRKPKIIPLEDAKVDLGCTTFVNSAEKELFAFALAVHSLFGAGQVRYSVEDWICELQSIEWRPQERVPDWRQVTIAAARRLAARKPWTRPWIGERSTGT